MGFNSGVADGSAAAITTHEEAADPHTGYVKEADVDAKGDLLAGTADNTLDNLTVGANDTILMADSAQTTGLKWVAPAATPSTQAFGDAAAGGSSDDFTRGDHKHAMPANPVTAHAAASDPHAGYVLDAAHDYALPTGSLAQTVPRHSVASVRTLVSQRVELVAIGLPAGLTVTSITFRSGGTAAGTPANQVFGLYDSSRVLLRSSVDDTTTAWAANTKKTLALTSTFVTTYSGLHYLAILVNAGTVPDLVAAAGTTNLNAETPILCGFSTTGVTALPDPAAAITAGISAAWAYVS